MCFHCPLSHSFHLNQSRFISSVPVAQCLGTNPEESQQICEQIQQIIRKEQSLLYLHGIINTVNTNPILNSGVNPTSSVSSIASTPTNSSINMLSTSLSSNDDEALFSGYVQKKVRLIARLIACFGDVVIDEDGKLFVVNGVALIQIVEHGIHRAK